MRKAYNKRQVKRLTNKEFSLIASNCNGGCLLHDLGLRFNSPFVNLWVAPSDIVRLLSNIHYYLSCEIMFDVETDFAYPIGRLDDVKIYFQHYSTKEMAKKKWEERKKRIDFDNLFIMFTDRDGCNYQDLYDFDALSYKNKVVFTHVSYPELKSAYYIKGWENEKSVGVCSDYKSFFQ